MIKRAFIGTENSHAFDVVKNCSQLYVLVGGKFIPVGVTMRYAPGRMRVGWVEVKKGRGAVVFKNDLFIIAVFDDDAFEASTEIKNARRVSEPIECVVTL